MKKTILRIATISSLLGIAACASQRPVLSTNAHLMRVGPGVGERDIDECIGRAKAAAPEGGESSDQNVVAGAATTSVVGTAAGGAGGAVVGDAAQALQQAQPAVQSRASRLRLCRDSSDLI